VLNCASLGDLMPCIHCCVGCWFIFQMGTVQWNKLEASKGSSLFCWSPSSTYITCPPFFEDLVSLVRTGQFGQNWSIAYFMLWD